ncbi:hypothetical protein D3C80_1336030 [compost metagenome]
MPLGNKVVLPADTAEHPPIFQLISNPGAHQGHGEHRVDEARIEALRALERLLTVQFVDVADGAHINAFAGFQRHVAQALVKRLGAEEEATMHQHTAIHRAPDDARLQQRQQAVDEHLTAAIQPVGKGLGATFAGNQLLPWLQFHVRK